MGVNTFILCLHYLQKCLSRVKRNVPCVFPLFGLEDCCGWMETFPPLLRMTQVRTCDLAKCRREAVTCMFLLQKLDHSPHLPRWPVPQTEFKEHQYCKVFYLISRCIFGQDSALPLFVFTFCRSVWTHTPCPLWWGWDKDCSGCRERIYPYHWDRPR